jgi:flavin reductase (DIM6/NTAB) family NADH-FMN oxidoreductase RutF
MASPRRGDEALRSDFLQAMRRLTSTVTIITKAHEEGALGMTATAVCSLTSDPPAILACINRNASICRWLVPNEAFCVNLLADGHAAVATQFAGKAPVGERFLHGEWRHDEHGLPYLADALCSLFCQVDLATDYGTHTILVGRVLRVRLTSADTPLLYGEGRFRTLTAAV